MNATLKPHHLDALRTLRANPAAWIEASTLGMLRKRGLVGKVITNAQRKAM